MKKGFSGAAVTLFLLCGLVVGGIGGSVVTYTYLDLEIASLKMDLLEQETSESPDSDEVTWEDVQEQNEQILDMAEKLKEN